jgi:hypothetical protein
MKTECSRIAEEIKSTLEGDAWYGDSVQKILAGITARQAFARPIASAHSIWELVAHVNVWAQVAVDAINGIPLPKFPMAKERDFPEITKTDQDSWQAAQQQLFETYRKLCKEIEKLDDSKLEEKVPGRSYNFYHLLHGMAQHAVYHAGQIALLKKT